MTTSRRGAPGAVGVLALLAGATCAFVVLGTLAHGGSHMTSNRSAPSGTRIWGAFHLPMAGCAALAGLLLARCCSGPLLWGLVGTATTSVYLLGVSAQALVFRADPARQVPHPDAGAGRDGHLDGH
jgi:hypothetical protein